MNELWYSLVEMYYVAETFSMENFIVFLMVVSNFLIFTILLLFLLVAIMRTKMIAKKTASLYPKLSLFFNDVLKNHKKYTDQEIVAKYNEIIKKKSRLAYNTSIDIMVELKESNNYSNEIIARVFNLLSLNTYVNNKTNHIKSSEVYKAIDILDQLDIHSESLNVLPHVNSKNTEIRKKARLSYFLSNEKESYNFFNTIDGDISRWDFIELMNSLEKLKEKGTLRSLGPWLANNTNKSVTCFLIKAIGHFNQFENKELLLEKALDKDEDIRIAAIEALGALKIEEVETMLTDNYEKETIECQKAIIKSIKNFNTGKSLDFLEKVYNNTYQHDIKTSIANTIYSYNGEGRNLFEKLKQTSNHSKLSILKHVETPLIKFKEYA